MEGKVDPSPIELHLWLDSNGGREQGNDCNLGGLRIIFQNKSHDIL